MSAISGGPILNVLVLVMSYVIAAACRRYVPRTARIPFLLLMLMAFVLEIILLVAYAVVVTELKG